MTSGPLKGVRVVEFAGIGPGPFCGMMLSDMGADVIRIDRNAPRDSRLETDGRGRCSISLNLKNPNDVTACLAICEEADILIEGYRPGVMERLGLGPEVVLKHNPRILYGRMTGWGQQGPYAQRAGHDINYIAITGVLDAIGSKEKPMAPLNLVGDYGGGALMLVAGLLAGLIEARTTGKGQVVDAAITDGTCYLTAIFCRLRAMGVWQDGRAANMLDGGAPFYDTYRCADDKFVSIGSIEPQFYALLLEKTGLTGKLTQKQMDKASWPQMKVAFADVFATKTRDQWVEIMGDADVCFAPVLTADEAAQDRHNIARSTFVEIDGVRQPAPAPRFSRTPSAIQPSISGTAAREVLEKWKLPSELVDQLI